MAPLKHLPNFITIIRIICSILLLFTKPLSMIFFILYIVCGVSDVLDGYIARKTKTNSQFGAVLDSISDTVFVGIILYILLPLFNLSQWMLLWIGVIAIVRFTSLAAGYLKYHKLTFLHTYANKITGFILFLSPFLFSELGMITTIIMICSIASVSAIEELVINITSKILDRDIKSIILFKDKKL